MEGATVSARLARRCQEAADNVRDLELRRVLVEIKAALEEPLRVAVAGRVSSGKSTLVNALLGQKVAPTGAGETTRLATWFRFGHPDRVQVETHDGRSWLVHFRPDGQLPTSLGADPAELKAVTAFLSNRRLVALTLIDTPGGSSASEGAADGRSEATADACRQAHALVYLVSEVVRTDDVDALGGILRSESAGQASALTTVGVLSKVDQLVDDPGDVETIAALASRVEVGLRNHVASVQPVMGLLAETAECGLLTESDAGMVRRFAALPKEDRDKALLWADGFRALTSVGEPQQRARLLGLLGPFGVRVGAEAASRGHATGTDLVELYRELSGIDRVRRLIHEHLATRADALKAAAALSALESLSYRDAPSHDMRTLRRLRGDLYELRSLPEMHQLEELWAVRQLSDGQIRLNEERVEAFRRLVLGRSPAEKLGQPPTVDKAHLRRTAIEEAGNWGALKNDARSSTAEIRFATIAKLSCEYLLAGLDET